MKRDDDLERRLDIAAEQEPVLYLALEADALEIERRVLAERAQVLADQALQLELDAARESEDARAAEATEVELGLRSIWDVPR